MDKKALRTLYKKKRAKLNEETIDSWSMQIANALLTLPIWKSSFYHLFLPIAKQKEVNTEFILHILQGKDKNVIVSKSNFENNTLQHILLTDTTVLQLNTWGIPEPTDGIPISTEKIEVVFIPLLAYDTIGNRVGYGKGFYDKFLSDCPHQTVKIGLSFFEPEIEIKDISSMDISLDYCVTPTNIYKF